MNEQIKISYDPPEAEEYVSLRLKAGLSGKDIEASRRGLRNSLFAVTLRIDGELIGMGRVIGDGGCMFHVVDIAVSPEHQGKGLGKKVMSEVNAYLDRNVPKGSYVSLMADVPADRLYQQFGFVYGAPASVGMYKKYN
ncbi:GNAT family N-acetyltransferase [Paenibacillus sp. KQZ6P-2]|uniref:GNAT family N-acetyltransferase n=1 Tax=Paenibacillus mangrovi TaxID=2931978 RepID=A0A9X1WQP7_9BACL|nr:GNAT family N-acetyltransferase [Paenibacillus mangrovi]MCJ8011600.1 GNAT family N-acetyltransferase [Paenibacillus mangrovi]